MEVGKDVAHINRLPLRLIFHADFDNLMSPSVGTVEMVLYVNVARIMFAPFSLGSIFTN